MAPSVVQRHRLCPSSPSPSFSASPFRNSPSSSSFSKSDDPPHLRRPARSLSDFATENGETDGQLWLQKEHPPPLNIITQQVGRRRSSLPGSKTEEDRTNLALLIQRQDEADPIPLRLPPCLQQKPNCLPSSSSSCSTSPLRLKKAVHTHARSNSIDNTTSSFSLFLPGHGEEKQKKKTKKLDQRKKVKDDPFLEAMEVCTKEEEEKEKARKEESSLNFYNMPSKIMGKLLQRKSILPFLCSSVSLSQVQPPKTVVKMEGKQFKIQAEMRDINGVES